MPVLQDFLRLILSALLVLCGTSTFSAAQTVGKWSSEFAGAGRDGLTHALATDDGRGDAAGDFNHRLHTYVNASTAHDVITDDHYIWVATDSGLFRIAKSDGAYIRHTVREGLRTNYVTSLAIDHEGALWAGMRLTGPERYSGLQGGVMRFEDDEWTTVYTTENGLPSNDVVSIAFDKSNHIWIGTDAGLSYFDDADWRYFDTSNAFEFYNNPLAIYFDADNHAWIGMSDGAYQYDGNDWQKYAADNHQRFNTIRSIAQTSDGSMWFGSATSGGIFRLRDGVWTNYTTDDGLISNRVVGLHATGGNTVLVVTHEGLSAFSGDTFENIQKDESIGLFLTSHMDSESTLYVGTVFSYAHNSIDYPIIVEIKEHRPRHFIVHNYLSSNVINDIVISTDGSVWFGTGSAPPVWDAYRQGVTRYNGNRWEHHWRGVEGAALGLGRLMDGRMWIGAYGFMSRFEGDAWRIFLFSPQGVFRFTDCSRGPCFFTNGWLYRFENDRWEYIHSRYDVSASIGAVTSLATDSVGGLWVGGYTGIMYIDSLENVVTYGEGDGLEFSDSRNLLLVRDILVDDGLVWIATVTGIYRFDGQTWQKLRADTVGEKVTFTSIARASDGAMWMGTVGEGLYRMEDDIWENYRVPDGLPSNIVTRISASPDGNVWVGTTDGLALFGDPARVNGPDIDVDTVILPRSEELPPESIALYTYPNPAASETTIVFELPRVGHVSLDLFDIQGRRVATVIRGTRYAGEHKIHFNTRELPSGAYVLRLEADGRMTSRSMMVVR